jgi:hypothetical protein
MKGTMRRILVVGGFLTAMTGLGALGSSAEATHDATQSSWYRSTNCADKAVPYVQKFNRSTIPFEEFSAGTIPALRGGSRVGEWIGNKAGSKAFDYMYNRQHRTRR